MQCNGLDRVGGGKGRLQPLLQTGTGETQLPPGSYSRKDKGKGEIEEGKEGEE